MAFFHHIHCKYTGVKGFVSLYNGALRYRYMITEKALKKAKYCPPPFIITARTENCIAAIPALTSVGAGLYFVVK